VCGGQLHVAEYRCSDCDVTLRGEFERCELCSLPGDLMHFVDVFLESKGNLRAVERRLGISYPTVKSRLAAVNAHLAASRLRGRAVATQADAGAAVPPTAGPAERDLRLALLSDFKAGRLTLDETVQQLRLPATDVERL
jgi:hypothetical protein